MYRQQPSAHRITPDAPPIGAAPEGQDFAHPWLITAMISALSFCIGFGTLYATGLWGKIWHWADGPFLFYLSILLPVIAGFSIYGLVVIAQYALGKTHHGKRGRAKS